jgi:hypothetical protein
VAQQSRIRVCVALTLTLTPREPESPLIVVKRTAVGKSKLPGTFLMVVQGKLLPGDVRILDVLEFHARIL